MEQVPQDNEHDEQQQPERERPILGLDLKGAQGNIFAVIGHARQVMPAEEQEIFHQEIQAAAAPGAGKTYEDMLAIVNTHVELLDLSETHPIYGDHEHIQDAAARYERSVIAAVDRLNEQILTLPETTPVQIDGMYPEFDDPDYSPEKYMAVLRSEIGRVETDIAQSGGEERLGALEKYRDMLRQCETSLRRTGVL